LEVEVLQIISRRKLRNISLHSQFRPLLYLCFYLSAFRKDIHCCRKIAIAQWQHIWYQEHPAFPKHYCSQGTYFGKNSMWTDGSLLKSHKKITSPLPTSKVGISPPTRTPQIIQQISEAQGHTIV